MKFILSILSVFLFSLYSFAGMHTKISSSKQPSIENSTVTNKLQVEADTAILYTNLVNGETQPECYVNLNKNPQLAPSFVDISGGATITVNEKLSECDSEQLSIVSYISTHAILESEMQVAVAQAIPVAILAACKVGAMIGGVTGFGSGAIDTLNEDLDPVGYNLSKYSGAGYGVWNAFKTTETLYKIPAMIGSGLSGGVCALAGYTISYFSTRLLFYR